jgi:hypothetical protein
MKFNLLVLTAVFITGCAHNAPVNIAPSYDVYSNYDEKLKGDYALYVDSSEMVKVVKAKGVACSAHTFPVDAEKAFAVSVMKTVENLVESVEMVDQPLDREDLVARGLRAQLVVKVKDMDADLVVIPGFWTSQIEADVEITASVEANNYEGRILGSTIEGDGDATADSGAFCDGGTKAIGEATAAAMKETMERLGERLANARKMREAESET